MNLIHSPARRRTYHARLQINAKLDVRVEHVLGFAAVREPDLLEGQHGRRQLVGVRKLERHHVLTLHRFDEAVGNHLVEDLRE
jgi:hypothetical protein